MSWNKVASAWSTRARAAQLGRCVRSIHPPPQMCAASAGSRGVITSIVVTFPLSSATPTLRPLLHSDFHVAVKLAPSEASDDGRAVTLELLVPVFVVMDFCTASP